MQLSPNQFDSSSQPQFQAAFGRPEVRFQSAFGRPTMLVDQTFRWLGANRTREMLVEDLVGFGLLRTGMDLFRGYFYGTNNNTDTRLNIPLARERLLREVGSIATDNVSSGVAAYLLAKFWLDRKNKAYSGRFSSFQNLETLQSLSHKSNNPQDLLKQLPPSATDNFSELRADADILITELKKKTGDKNWSKQAQILITNTLKAKRIQMSCLGVGIGLTMAVPYANHWLTRRINQIDYYPGEIGLKNMTPKNPSASPSPVQLTFQQAHQPRGFSAFLQAQKNTLKTPIQSWSEKTFPYLSDSVKNNNYWPVVATVLPLPAALGLFDTVRRQFNAPWKKGFLTQLRNLYEFGKGFPFTTQQQMASMFAFLIISRLASARSGNEFRERLVDSFLGWGIWILGTPLIKRAVAQYLDRNQGTQLLKQTSGQWVVKTRQEIEQRLTGSVLQKTLKAHIWLQAGSVLTTMVLLGIVEPYLAMLWTKKRSQKQA